MTSAIRFYFVHIFLLSQVLLATGPGSLRQTISLNKGWSFQRQVNPGSEVEWQFRDAWEPSYDDSRWSKVFLPHSWDEMAHNPWVTIDHWRGIGWYRKEFSVPGLAPGQRVFLEFEAAMQVAKVWVNGREAGEHVGGYTGFVLDVTDLVKAGGDNLLAVRVDDTNSPDIPPATEENTADYGGLYRDVWLHITGPVLIPYGGISLTTPEVSKERSTVRVITEVRNSLGGPTEVKVASEVASGDGTVVARAEQQKHVPGNSTVSFEPAGLTVVRPELWSPDHPNLYTLRSHVYPSGGELD